MEADNGEILLVHRGKIGGGRPGIGRSLFFNNYAGDVEDINGKRFAVIGDINSPDFVQKIEFFIKEVDRIKSLV